MDVYLHALGCRLNEAELERWHRDLDQRGHRVVRRADKAQVVVLNTCAVTGVAARKSRQLVGRFHRQNPNAHLVITGCYAEMDPQKVASLAGVDLVVGNQDKARLVDLITTELDVTAMPRMAAEVDEGSHLFAEARTRAFVKVQDGCRNQCSFCVVTILRGAERSRPIDDVVAEINALHEQGYNEAVVTGVHLGGYGSDLGTDLKSLLAAILERTSIPRLRVTSLEPWDLPPDFFELWSDPRLGGHLHLPLQSGCDSVLRRMARRCFTADFEALVASARKNIPELTLTTDIIVGFPGETEAEWEATKAFVRQIGFAHMHIFSYSPREGTRAATMSGQITRDVQRRRNQEMHEIGAVAKAAHLERFLGEQRTVLWEGNSEVLEDGRRRWLGYTDNYLRVQTHTSADVDLENQLLLTELTMSTGEHLMGTVVELPTA